MPSPRLRAVLAGALLALAAPVVAAPAASARPAAARPAVSSLAAGPAQAVQGSSFTVRAGVAPRTRRAVRARITLSLRSSARSSTAHLLGTRTVRLVAGRTRTVTLAARVRRTLVPTTYALVACVRVGSGPSSCTQASRGVTVLPRVTPSPAAPAPAPAPAAPVATPAPVPTIPAPPVVPAPPAEPDYRPGARSAGDADFPQIGNGGYDSRHYDLSVRYDPASRDFAGATTLDAVATQDLSEMSLDLEGMRVDGVRVDGAAVAFRREATKLVVDLPAPGVRQGTAFTVAVAYSGTPTPITDPDDSIEGWVPTPDGAFVVGEPVGAQGWFPSNNVPSDKATYDITVDVPDGTTALGNGELVGEQPTTLGHAFHWRETHPMATYLATATLGDFDLTTGKAADGSPTYTAVDSAALAALSPDDRETFTAGLARQEDVIRTNASLYGPYPFSSFGGIYDDAPDVGYALESQTKPNYDRLSTVDMPHELSHQWFGDSVGLAQWKDIWLNEGFATWAGDWYYPYVAGDSTQTPAEAFADLYATPADDELWEVPPADPTAAELFGDQSYVRGSMALEGYRQIVGDATFFATLRRWVADHAYGTATTADWIALTQSMAGGRDLTAYWQDWLYESGKPTTLPADVR